MQDLRQDENGIYQFFSMMSISSATTQAIAFSAKESRPVSFHFNGMIITVNADSDASLIFRDWLRAGYGLIDKNVGPYPKPALTDQEMADIDYAKAENERRIQEMQEQYEAEEAVKQEFATRAKLVNAPEIELIDALIFKHRENQNPNDLIVAYAKRWAQLMQLEMLEGKKLEDIAESTSQEADFDEVDGLMHLDATVTLVRCWKYGEKLRNWHNRREQSRKGRWQV